MDSSPSRSPVLTTIESDESIQALTRAMLDLRIIPVSMRQPQMRDPSPSTSNDTTSSSSSSSSMTVSDTAATRYSPSTTASIQALITELRGMITNHVLPDIIIQISPGGECLSINQEPVSYELGRGHPSPYQYIQLSRIVEQKEITLLRHYAVVLTDRNHRVRQLIDFSREIADLYKFAGVQLWFEPVRDRESNARMRNLFNMLQVSRMVAVETIATAVSTYILIVTAGDPVFEELTLTQQVLAVKSQTLVLSYPSLLISSSGYNRFITHLPLLENVMLPSLELSIEADPNFWNGLEIACGLYAGSGLAHLVVEACLNLLVPPVLQRPDQNGFRLFREVFVCNSMEFSNTTRPNGPSAGLHLLLRRDVGPRHQNFFIVGAFWRDSWRNDDRLTWRQVLDHQRKWDRLQIQQTRVDVTSLLPQVCNPMFFDTGPTFPGSTANARARFTDWYRRHQRYNIDHRVQTQDTTIHFFGRVFDGWTSSEDF